MWEKPLTLRKTSHKDTSEGKPLTEATSLKTTTLKGKTLSGKIPLE